MNDEEEEETLLYCYNYICHYTLNLSHLYSVQASNIQNKILEPFDLFAENFNETNKTLTQNAKKVPRYLNMMAYVLQLLDSLQGTKAEVIQKQEAYVYIAGKNI
mgnify:FL=1